MDSQMNSLFKNNTWRLLIKPVNKSILDVKPVSNQKKIW